MPVTCQMCTGWQGSLERLNGNRNYSSRYLVPSPAMFFEGGGCQAGFGSWESLSMENINIALENLLEGQHQALL